MATSRRRVCCSTVRTSYGHRRRHSGILLELEEKCPTREGNQQLPVDEPILISSTQFPTIASVLRLDHSKHIFIDLDELRITCFVVSCANDI